MHREYHNPCAFYMKGLYPMKTASHDRVLKIVLSGLFAAVIFVLTAFVPIPLGHGYANAGDVFVVLSGVMLGPWAGLRFRRWKRAGRFVSGLFRLRSRHLYHQRIDGCVRVFCP